MVGRRRIKRINEDKMYVSNWDKETIRFIINNEEKIRTWIAKSLNKHRNHLLLGRANTEEIDDVYQNLLVYFSTARDYKEELASSIEIYIRAMVRRLAMNYNSSLSKEKVVMQDAYTNGVFSTKTQSIEDEIKFDAIDLELNLSKALKALEHKRSHFKNGKFDLYDILYIIYIYKKNPKANDLFRWMFSKELADKLTRDGEIVGVIELLNKHSDVDEVLDELESWSYRAPVLQNIRKHLDKITKIHRVEEQELNELEDTFEEDYNSNVDYFDESATDCERYNTEMNYLDSMIESAIDFVDNYEDAFEDVVKYNSILGYQEEDLDSFETEDFEITDNDSF